MRPDRPGERPGVASLFDRKLVFITGKGGVGKSTVTAALARASARRGKRVLICEVDTDSTMGRMFAARNIGFEPVKLERNVFASNVTGQEALHRFIQRFLKSKRLSAMLIKNKVAGVLFESAPSVMETVILDQIAALATESQPAFDQVIVDLPATGHALTLLNVPRSMAQAIKVGDMARHLSDLAALIADPDKSELVLVTLPEEMPVNETIELWRGAAERVEVKTRLVCINAVRRPDLVDGDVAVVQRVADSAEGAEVEALERITLGVRLADFWVRDEQEHVARLRDAINAQFAEVPYVFDKVSETDLVDRVARVLETQL